MSELNKNKKDILNKLVISEKEVIEKYEIELKELTHEKIVSHYRSISDKIHRVHWLFNMLYKRQKDINEKLSQENAQLKKQLLGEK